jgi:methionyl-tRNA formyltransferase
VTGKYDPTMSGSSTTDGLEPRRPTVLFFGREGCSRTRDVLKLLEAKAQTVEFFESSHRGEQLPSRVTDWSGDLIFCFRSFHVLSPHQIGRATIGAINFHPGPPEYPGSGCTNWALLEGAKQFGVTAHLIAEKIDSGPILSAERFEIFPTDNIESLLSRTHDALASLALRTIEKIFSLDEPGKRSLLASAPAEQWSGRSRPMRELDELRRVSSEISPQELENRIRAVHHPNFPLYAEIAGRKFRLDDSL